MRKWVAMAVLVVLLWGCAGGRGPQKPGPAPADPPQHTELVVYDIVIRGGQVLDGSGAPAATGDVAITGDKITAVGTLGQYQARRVIDAAGLVVAPGFINPHSHTHDNEINPNEDWDATASLMQGITTEFGGVDGRSPLPVGAELEKIAQIGTGVNFALFVGQGSVRQAVMGNATGAASPAQLEQMKEAVRQAMEEGAFGLSSGLEYMPGGQAKTDEVAALVGETKANGGIYSTHLRSEGDRIVESLQEAVSIAKTAGVPLNVSHFKIVKYPNWGKTDQVIKVIDQARAGGLKVFADVYPYLAPDYAVNRPLSEWKGVVPPEYLMITQAKDAALVGKTVAEAGKAAETDPALTVVALINSEQAMIRFYQSDWSVVSTDGESQPRQADPARALALRLHRRSYGSYPQLLGYYVRERNIMPLETMVRKMSGAVADNLNLKDRGYLKLGYYADVVLFNPTEVADRTIWLRPQEYPAGISFVMVNGAVAVENGKRLEGRPGRIVRRGR